MRRVVVYWEKMNHLPVCHQLPTRQNPPELPSAGQLPQGGTANNTTGRVSNFHVRVLGMAPSTSAPRIRNSHRRHSTRLQEVAPGTQFVARTLRKRRHSRLPFPLVSKRLFRCTRFLTRCSGPSSAWTLELLIFDSHVVTPPPVSPLRSGTYRDLHR